MAAWYNDGNDIRKWWHNKGMHTIEIKWKNGYDTGEKSWKKRKRKSEIKN